MSERIDLSTMIGERIADLEGRAVQACHDLANDLTRLAEEFNRTAAELRRGNLPATAIVHGSRIGGLDAQLARIVARGQELRALHAFHARCVADGEARKAVPTPPAGADIPNLEAVRSALFEAGYSPDAVDAAIARGFR